MLFLVFAEVGAGLGKASQHCQITSVPPDFSYPATDALVEYERQFVFRSLRGQIVSPVGNRLQKVLVEHMSADWKTRLKAVLTDDKGRFRLPSKRRGRYNIQLSLTGYSKVRLIVRTTPTVQSNFVFELPFAN